MKFSWLKVLFENLNLNIFFWIQFRWFDMRERKFSKIFLGKFSINQFFSIKRMHFWNLKISKIFISNKIDISNKSDMSQNKISSPYKNQSLKIWFNYQLFEQSNSVNKLHFAHAWKESLSILKLHFIFLVITMKLHSSVEFYFQGNLTYLMKRQKRNFICCKEWNWHIKM